MFEWRNKKYISFFLLLKKKRTTKNKLKKNKTKKKTTKKRTNKINYKKAYCLDCLLLIWIGDLLFCFFCSLQQRPLVHHTTPVLVNGPIGNRNQSLIHPPTPIAVNGQRVSNGNQSLVQPTAPIVVNGQPVSNGNQLDLFSQRLKQLAAGTNSSNAITVPRIINTVNM